MTTTHETLPTTVQAQPNKMISFLKNNFLLQNLAARLFVTLPPMIEHNFDKYRALKKAFYLTGLEQLEGDYLEFGVFTGSSFVFSTRAYRKMKWLSGDKTTRFFGFDSFQGFGKTTAEDAHPFYQDGTFSVNYQKVLKNIQANAGDCSVTLVPGFFEQTLQKSAQQYGINKSRIVFIDCDLKVPARAALDFVLPTLQAGTILVMDDFFSYRGQESLGITGAFNEFNAANTRLQWRRVCDYGYGGVVMICSQI